jgi:hypothetical protein
MQMKPTHLEEDTLTCTKCLKTFKNQRGLSIHSASCKVDLVCEFCEKVFSDNKNYHNHKRTCIIHFQQKKELQLVEEKNHSHEQQLKLGFELTLSNVKTQHDFAKKQLEDEINALKNKVFILTKTKANEGLMYESTLQKLKEDSSEKINDLKNKCEQKDVEIEQLKRDLKLQTEANAKMILELQTKSELGLKEQKKEYTTLLHDQEVKYEARIAQLERIHDEFRKENANLMTKALDKNTKIIYNNTNHTTNQHIINLESVKAQELQEAVRDFLYSNVKKQELTFAKSVAGAVRHKVVKTDSSRNKIEWVNENNVRVYDSNGREFTQFLFDSSAHLFAERLDDLQQHAIIEQPESRVYQEFDQSKNFIERVVKRDPALEEKVGKYIAKLTPHKKNFQTLIKTEDNKWKFFQEMITDELQHHGCFAFTNGGIGLGRWLLERLADNISLPNYGEDEIIQVINNETNRPISCKQEDLASLLAEICNWEEIYDECFSQLSCCHDDAFSDVDNANTNKTKREVATSTFVQTFQSCKDKGNPIYEVVYETILTG